MSALRVYIVILTCLLLVGIAFGQQAEYVKGELFFKIVDHQPIDDKLISSQFSLLEDQYQIISVQKAFHLPDEKLQRTYLLKFAKYELAIELIKAIEAFGFIDYVERVPLYKTSYTPNDLHPNQWNLPNISAELAWNITTGSTNVVVAMVDDAVLITHQDLASNIWVNPGEIPGNGIDDDGNGYADDINGYDVADGDNDPNPPIVNPGNQSHGTHCAGIVSAATDNNTGIASIGFNIKIMAVKTQQSSTPSFSPYPGVQYAIAAGADIISMSWGGGGFSNTYQNLFNYANSQGIVLVAAAGNSNTSLIHYPAGYNYVIAVGATNSSDQKASFSNYGTWVDVMAPGKDIWSTVSTTNSSYDYKSGTSMACPLVAGLCGLMLSASPDLTPAQVESCLKSSCDNIDQANPNYIGQIGAGRINAHQALTCLQIPPSPDFTANFLNVCPGEPVQFIDLSLGLNINGWSWLFPGGTPSNSAVQNPVITYPVNGTYDVTLTATNPYGSNTVTKTTFITVSNPTATISGSTTIMQGTSAPLAVYFTGTPPFSITYSDGSTTQTISGINSNPYIFSVSPATTTTYLLTAMENDYCTGTGSGTATITVVPPSQSLSCLYANIYGDTDPNPILGSLYDAVNDDIYIVIDGGGNSFNYISKIDKLGNIVWTQRYNMGNNSRMNMVFTPNRDILMAGSHNSSDFFVLRADPSGNVIWSKSYSAGGRERVPLLVNSINDTYIIGSWYASSGTSDDVTFLKIDGNGNILWTTKLHTSDDQIGDIIPDGSGGCIFTGEIIAGNHTIFLGNIDLNGNVQWLKRINANDREIARGIIRTLDGGLAIAGKVVQGVNEAFFIKLDSSLNISWIKTFDGLSLSDNMPARLIQDKHGSYYIPVATTLGGQAHKGMIAKYSSAGTPIWFKTLDFISDGFNHRAEMFNTNSSPNDNIVLVGRVDGHPNGFGGLDGIVIRTDTSLNNCITGTVSPNLGTAPWTISDWTPTVNNINFSVSNLNLVGTNVVFGKHEICATCTDSCSASAVISYSDSIICEGEAVSFTSDSTAPMYNWLINGVLVSSVRSFSNVFNDTGRHIITLIVSDSLCSDIDSVEVLVNSLPSIKAFSDTTICHGERVQLLATGGDSYVWTPSTGLSNPNIANPIASPSQSISYKVTALDSTGCQGKDSVMISLESCCGSRAIFKVSDSTICAGDSVLFINQSVTNGAVTYQWIFGNGTSASLTNPLPVYFDSGGVYSVLLILSDSCGVDTAWQNIYVFDLPTPLAGDDTAFCSTGTFTYQLGETPISDHVYSWIPTTGLSDPSIANPIATITGSIVYYLYETDIVTTCQGMDSVVIEVHNDTTINIDTSLCQGETLTVGNSIYASNGTFRDTLSSLNGCDSVIITNLTIKQTGILFIQDTICDGDSVLIGGGYQTSGGIYSDTLMAFNGCDSIRVTELTVNQSTFINIQENICEGETITIGGINYSSAGTYMNTYTTPNGCDSTVIVDISAWPVPVDTLDRIICQGESYTVGASIYTTSGNYSDTLSTLNSCDSIVLLNLIVSPNNSFFLDTTLCEGESLVVGDSVYENVGIYVDTLNTFSGCDSVLTINLRIISVNDTSYAFETCPDDTIQLTARYGNSFTWQAGPGIVDPGLQAQLVSPDITTNYLVEISDSNGCTVRDSFDVRVFMLPDVINYADTSICIGDNIQLISVGADIYTWAPSTYLNNSSISDPIATPLISIQYVVSFIDSNDCTGNDSVLVIVDSLDLQLTEDTIICLDHSIKLKASGALDYIWDNGETSAVLEVRPTEATSYSVRGFSGNCTEEKTVNIEVEPCDCNGYYIPNAFSPNDDQINYLFEIYPLDKFSKVRSLQIFDRWGETLFKTEVESSWDGTYNGKRLTNQVLIYHLVYECDGKEFIEKGSVTLIR